MGEIGNAILDGIQKAAEDIGEWFDSARTAVGQAIEDAVTPPPPTNRGASWAGRWKARSRWEGSSRRPRF